MIWHRHDIILYDMICALILHSVAWNGMNKDIDKLIYQRKWQRHHVWHDEDYYKTRLQMGRSIRGNLRSDTYLIYQAIYILSSDEIGKI